MRALLVVFAACSTSTEPIPAPAPAPTTAPAAAADPRRIPGVEWTTGKGHFTVTGVDVASLGDDLLASAHAAGAFISVNHPFAVPTSIGNVASSHYDMSYRVWTEHARGFTAIDGVEVWNFRLGVANLVSRPGGRTGEDRAWTEVHEEHRRITVYANLASASPPSSPSTP